MKEKNKNSPKILFIDIETSYATGWFWRPGYNLNITYDQILTEPAIICVCYKYNDSGKVYSLSWDKGDDKELCKEFHRILNTADIVVGHNGDKFDIPWLKTRMLFHGISNMPEIQSIDTLKIARSKFKFNSNRLDYLGKFFGFGGKKDTGGIDLWHDIIQHNSNIALKKMISYCCRDVILLEKVYNKFNRAILFDTTQNSWHGLPDPINCPEDVYRKSLAIYYVSPPRAGVEQHDRALFAPYGEQANNPDILELIKKRSSSKTSAGTYRT